MDATLLQPMRTLRSVLIVDDHPLYSDALAASLRDFTDVKRIENARTMGDALQILAKRFIPNLVFFDLNLPDVTGVTGFLNIVKKLPQVPIVVISATSTPEVIDVVFEEGAAGYISKNLGREDLQSAIQMVLDGKRYFPPEYLSALVGQRASRDQDDLHEISLKLAQLTPQQSRILEMICEGKLNKQIAYDLDLAEATVKTHITALMRRLGVQNRTQAALLVRDAMTAANLE